jgi:methylated-DNA-[protein]-cysteine S-methyltransferase
MIYTRIESPIGPLLLAGDDAGLRQMRFAPAHPEPGWEESEAPFATAVSQLEEYFAGKRRVFDLGLRMEGTPFQLRVWSLLREIPYGAVRSYGEIARLLGTPNASRAVGAANGANPIPIIVPCHRVIGANGSLTGFGGGIDVKRRLLDLERGLRPLY